MFQKAKKPYAIATLNRSNAYLFTAFLIQPKTCKNVLTAAKSNSTITKHETRRDIIETRLRIYVLLMAQHITPLLCRATPVTAYAYIKLNI